MSDYGTAFIAPQSQTIYAGNYVYNWINRNEGPARVPDLAKTTGGGSFYFDAPIRGVLVYDTVLGWVAPTSVWDAETATWLPYEKVFAGGKWVVA